MSNFKQFKCSNCGSTNFKQISDDLFECKYCSTKIQNDNSIKDDFIKSISSANKLLNKVRFIKPSFSEEEFYKKAVGKLFINKNVSDDVINSNFAHVVYGYEFVACLDVDFTVLSNDTTRGISQLFNVSSGKDFLCNHGKNFYIKLSEELTPEDLNKLSNVIDDNTVMVDTASDIQRISKAKLPNKTFIESHINNAISDYKSNLIPSGSRAQYITHKINDVVIYAIPTYTLEYEYNGKKYFFRSFAYDMEISSVDFPSTNADHDISVAKRTIPLTLCSSIVSIISIIFAFVLLSSRRDYLIKIELLLLCISVLVFLVSIILNSIITRKLDNMLFKKRMEMLKSFLKNKGYMFTQDDENYANFLKGGWRK